MRAAVLGALALSGFALGCSEDSAGGAASGGAPATGGAVGTGQGGAAVGGSSMTSGGVVPATGGAAATSGGSVSMSGQSGAAGSASGGVAGPNGGAPSGGAATGGAATAGASGGGAGGNGGASAGGASTVGGSGGTGGVAVPDGYKLVWADEFDVDGAPNPDNWTYEKGFVRNEEAQWYQADNASVAGGFLVIEGRREQVRNPNYQAGSSDWKRSRQYAEYTASSLITSGRQSWQYGRFEMRARIPARAGMWPAWWTLGVSGEWPTNGEVDIMEFYQSKVLANFAVGTGERWVAEWDSLTRSLSQLGGEEWIDAFHVWRMDWDEERMVIFLDDEEMNSLELDSMPNPDGQSPFRQPEYMLVNLAIGGMNGGDPSGTEFPVRYEVDYLRVFQREQ